MAEQQKNTKNTKNQNKLLVKANKKGRHINVVLNILHAIYITCYRIVKPFRYFGNRKIQNGPFIFISNHLTAMDPVYQVATTWESIRFVAKKEISETPVLNVLAKGIKVIYVNRNGNDVRALLDCLKCLKNGEKLAIYPEGTRNKVTEEIQPFKHGAAAMAIKTKTPVIPMVIYHRPKFFRMTHVLIGDPVELTEYYDRKLSEEELAQADEKLRQIMIKMRSDHTEYLQNKKKGKKA